MIIEIYLPLNLTTRKMNGMPAAICAAMRMGME